MAIGSLLVKLSKARLAQNMPVQNATDVYKKTTTLRDSRATRLATNFL